MAEYGYLIIRNPGPKTEIIYGGFSGGSRDLESPKDAITEVNSRKEDGDSIHYLTLYSPDETDGISSQLAADGNEAEFSER